MPFSTRVFCRDAAVPSLSEMLLWLRQHDAAVTVVGDAAAPDLLSPFWDQVLLAYADDEAPLRVSCLRPDSRAHDGFMRFRDELLDFQNDVKELPASSAREGVLAQLAATRALIVIEFPPGETPERALQTNGWLMSLFVERASGMAQTDGVGFFDEDEDVLLPLA